MHIFFVTKILISASIIAIASDLSKKSALAAAITLSLPLTSLLALVWVNYETNDREKLIALSWDIFWLVPPSLAFFPAFAHLVGRNVPFWMSFLLASGLTIVVYLVYAKVLGFFGIKL
jgi:hypothetical protein